MVGVERRGRVCAYLLLAHLRLRQVLVRSRAGAVGVGEAWVVQVLVLPRRAERLPLFPQPEHPRGNGSIGARGGGGERAEAPRRRGKEGTRTCQK